LWQPFLVWVSVRLLQKLETACERQHSRLVQPLNTTCQQSGWL